MREGNKREKNIFFFFQGSIFERDGPSIHAHKSLTWWCVYNTKTSYTYRVLGSCCQQPQQAVHITGIKVYLSLSGVVCVYDFNPVDLLLDSFLSFFPFFSILFC